MSTSVSLLNYLPTSMEGKSILLTGGSAGIGRATAHLLAKQGARLIIVGQDPRHLEDTMVSLQQEAPSADVYPVNADLGTEEGIEEVFKVVDNHFNKLDILINNAAIAYNGLMSESREDWQKVVNINLLGYMSCARQAISRMQVHRRGHIIQVGSMSADVREKDSSVYVATKSAIQGFSESLRKEVNELGIKVTLIEPGAVGTDMQPIPPEEQEQQIDELKMLKAEDIAAAILYALSQPTRCDVVEMKIRPHLQMI